MFAPDAMEKLAPNLGLISCSGGKNIERAHARGKVRGINGIERESAKLLCMLQLRGMNKRYSALWWRVCIQLSSVWTHAGVHAGVRNGDVGG